MPTRRSLNELDLCARRIAGLGIVFGVLLSGVGVGCHGTNARDQYYGARGATVMPQPGDGSALVAEPVDMFELLAATHREADEAGAVAAAGERARGE